MVSSNHQPQLSVRSTRNAVGLPISHVELDQQLCTRSGMEIEILKVKEKEAATNMDGGVWRERRQIPIGGSYAVLGQRVLSVT